MKIKYSKKDTQKKVFFLTLLLCFLMIVFFLPRVVLPLGVAYVLFLMFRPVRLAFKSVSLKKKIFATLGLLFLLFMVSYPLITGVSTLTAETHNLESYFPKLEAYLRVKYNFIVMEVERRFNYKIEFNPIDTLIQYGQIYTKDILVYFPKLLGSFLEWSFIVPLFWFFLIKDGKKMKAFFIKLIPNPWVEKTYYLFHQFNTKFGDYIFAKFIEATIVGCIITTGLFIIDYPFALLLGVVAALTNILPYIGPILGFLPALIIGLVDQNPDTTLGAMVILYFVANLVDLALVFPLLVSKIVNLHPMVVILSVILGSQFGGAIGMIISIPMAAFIKLLLFEVYKDLYGDTFSSD